MLGTAFHAARERAGLTLPEVYTLARDHEDLYQLAELLIEWDERVVVWRARHFVVVERVIGGHVVGTQGTPVEVLGKLIHKRSYPELWEVRRMTMRPEGYLRLANDRTFDGLDRLEAEAKERGVDIAALAFAWVLSHPDVAGAVCGPTRPAHLEPVLVARDLELTAEDRERIGSFFG